MRAAELRVAMSPDVGMPLPPKIRVERLVKRFGAFTAVDDISVDIAPGEFFVIVGPSGCGKTTLLRILAGLEAPSAGSIAISPNDAGRPVNSMVFQGDSIFPWMSVYDNAAYGLAMRRRPKAEIAERVRPLLESTGLWRFRDRYPHQLSGGMRQRVSICRAFANDPDILLMDEPFSALDEQNKMLLHQELLRIWDETKKTVVFITHSVDEAVTLSDRIMVMTAHPGRAKVILDNPFGRPRDVVALRGDPTYGAFVFRIWEYLREEVRAAKLQEQGESEA
jgi:NitT/TauT family transport system ATP-binding protein